MALPAARGSQARLPLWASVSLSVPKDNDRRWGGQVRLNGTGCVRCQPSAALPQAGCPLATSPMVQLASRLSQLPLCSPGRPVGLSGPSAYPTIPGSGCWRGAASRGLGASGVPPPLPSCLSPLGRAEATSPREGTGRGCPAPRQDCGQAGPFREHRREVTLAKPVGDTAWPA